MNSTKKALKMKGHLRVTNIVITGVSYTKVYEEIRSDLMTSCPEVLVKDIKISYAPVNYHKSDIKPRRNDIVGSSFRSGRIKLNLLATRCVSEIRELWLETAQSDPDYVLIHCVNSENSNGIANDDKPYLILTHLLSREPKAIFFAIAGKENIAKQVSSYIDVAVSQDYGKYSGFVTKIFYNDDEPFRNSQDEIIARSMNNVEETRHAPGIYALIDDILEQYEVTCVKLSNSNIRERPREVSRAKDVTENIGNAAVSFGFNDCWRQYSEGRDWRPVSRMAMTSGYARNQSETPVTEVVSKLLNKQNAKKNDEYFYSDTDSSQSQLTEHRDSAYHSTASYTRSIRNVSDSSSADSGY